MVTKSLRDAYEENLRRFDHVRDPAQERVLAELIDLQEQVVHVESSRLGWLKSLFGGKGDRTRVKGLYIWGGVGRGKTFLMDLFYETLAIERKRRVHFHRMMRDVHQRLKRLGDIEDPLDRVAEDIARETRVLCFDEFFVSDIGDAMILGRLLDGLFSRGVALVTTSNSPPGELYKDGLQRQRFLPAIASLEANTCVVNLDSDTDYRLRLLEKAGTYFSPVSVKANRSLDRIFDETALSQIERNHVLDVNGREIVARRCAKGIAWFDFVEICDGPRGPDDYIELARWFPTVIVSAVPQFDTEIDHQARRFISLVDEFYDRHVKLMLSAATGPADLYTGQRLEFEFERTASRLIELQSTDYLCLPHLA